MNPQMEPRSTYQRYIDRYIDVTTWPTSQKTAMLMGLAIPFHALAYALVLFFRPELAPIADVAGLEAHFRLWLGAVVLLALVAIPPARRGLEARWTIYLVILIYGGLVCRFAQMLGTMSSPFAFLGPVVVVLVTLFIDARAGLLGLVFCVVVTSVLVAGELSGAIPYAPLLTARDIDAQNSPAWVTIQGLYVLMVSIFVFVLLQLAQSARDAQRQKLQETQGRLERSTALIRRYVPTQLAEKILSGEHSGERQPERRKLTLFFSDVVEFTQASDRMEPEELSDLLNEYLAEMTAIADSAGATINQFVGDGIMMFFGAPSSTTDQDHAVRAVHMAVAMQDRMSELRERWYTRGIQTPFRIRIGINTGVASVGDFGSQGRTTYSAIGTQTNLTARIQAECEPGRVLISHATWALVHHEIACEERGEIEVKGLHFPVKVYEVSATTASA